MAVQILHAAVHLAMLVRKNAQLQHFGQQAIGRFGRVLRLGAYQRQQALLNSADLLPGNTDMCPTYALQYGFHACSRLNLGGEHLAGANRLAQQRQIMQPQEVLRRITATVCGQQRAARQLMDAVRPCGLLMRQ